MLIAQAIQNFSPRKSQIFQQVASMFGQAAAMRVHVADRDLVRYPGIKHCECRVQHAEFGVPGDFSFTNQLGNQCRANRFGNRRELKHRVRVNGRLGVHIAHAKTFCVHHLVLKHDRDGQTRHRVFLNLFLRQFFEFLNGSIYLLRSDLGLFGWRRER